ncbi:gluconolaconase [Mycolicibacterium sp. 050158]|uniref:PQQ-dependent sugar dehydrogenase n=1 Tax=Mycolicibacterium sp. 050158 TaxID=3090602 RepID=UPI00299E5761|nr:gluconolaconase [Mycolicibacterium sp. 050158]MDX1889414.1 gluconolaconase [Mycolicibacterium sp. 050158]
MRAWPQRSHRTVGLAVGLTGVLLLAGCSSATTPPASDATAPSTPTREAGLSEVTVQVSTDLAAAPFDEPRKALVPNGWTMSVWARVPKPRLAVWAPDGALLVSLPSSGQVARIQPSGLGPQMELLVNGMNQPHGLAFAGDTLYVAEADQIDAFDYADGKTVRPRTIAAGLPDARSPELGGAYAHALKSVAVGPDGALYFSIGSTGNVSAGDRTATPQRATIMRVPPGGGPYAPFATGVRNGTGLAVAPDGSVWTAVNNRDDVAVPDQGPTYGQVLGDYVGDHPPESLAKLTPGRELGWPYCNPDGGPANLRLIRDVQTNADGSKLDCSALPPIEQSMGAHSAPLGMSFVDGSLPEPYAHGALVGVHGSWNRQPPRAPEVSFFPWANGTLGNQQTLVGGFQDADGSRWGRPVDAVVGPDGAVYVTDDAADAIYRLAPPGR